VGVGAGLAALSDWNESQFESNFGTMELDMAAIDGYIQSIGAGFRDAYAEANQFKDAVNGALKDYQDASGSLSSSLMSKMLTKAELTSADKRELERLADQMYSALTDAISNSAAATQSYWAQLLSGGDDGGQVYAQIMDLTNQASQEAMLEAEQISQDLRAALTSAFADGEISPEEYQNILGYMNAYNDAIARAAAEAKSEDDYVRMQGYLHKAQSASWDEIEGIITDATDDRDQVLQEQEDAYQEERFRLEYRWDRAIEEGWMINGQLATLEGKQAALETLDEEFQKQQDRTSAAYDQLILDLYETALMQSDLAGPYQDVLGIAGQYRSGEINWAMARQKIIDQYGRDLHGTLPNLIWGAEASDLGEILSTMSKFYGGAEGLAEKISYYEGIGDKETAERLLNMALAGNLIEYTGGFEFIAEGQEESDREIFGRWLDPFHYREEERDRYPVYGASAPAYTFPENENAEPGEFTWIQLGSGTPTVEVPVTADTTELDQTLQNYQAPPIVARVFGMKEYAGGGRATQASIFGEAGAEWAIPEEHSERTAALLNAARAASGWSWPDLLARFGGMNANAGHVPTTVVYSPTIHAQDASGVEEALRRDKRRLEKWLEELRARDAAEVYA
jgi:hypothetical protein